MGHSRTCLKGCCQEEATRFATYYSAERPVSIAPSCQEHGGAPFYPLSSFPRDFDLGVELWRLQGRMKKTVTDPRFKLSDVTDPELRMEAQDVIKELPTIVADMREAGTMAANKEDWSADRKANMSVAIYKMADALEEFGSNLQIALEEMAK